MRMGLTVVILPLLLGACASSQQPPAALASKAGSEPAPIEARPAPVRADSAALDWKRLEAAVAEAARDKRMRIAPGRLRAAAIAYAHDINRIPAEHMRQFHIDRASLVLERDVFSGETLAEGANLRATVSGGGGGGGVRGSRSTRNSGGTSRSGGSSSGNNRSNSNTSGNSSGF